MLKHLLSFAAGRRQFQGRYASSVLQILVLMLFFSCQRNIDIQLEGEGQEEEPQEETGGPIDPSNANQLSKSLVITGAARVESAALPASSTTPDAPAVANYDQTISYSSGSTLVLPADISSASGIIGVYIQVKGASHYYDVPISRQINDVASVPIDLSALVTEGTFILVCKYYDSNRRISAANEIKVTVTKPSNCATTKVSGGQGLTSNIFKLGNESGKIRISYDTYVVKDKIDVFQKGVWIGGTGPQTDRSTLRKALDCNVATEANGYFGKKSAFLFNYDPTLGSDIEVVVSGCENGGTRWEYTFSCPGDIGNFDVPVLSTTPVSNIAGDAAKSGGTISNDNGSDVTERGIVWSTSPGPTVALTSKTKDGKGTGTFTSSMVGMLPNTKYYVRAYATNDTGTGYGNELSFSTVVNVNMSLDGKWLSQSGTGVEISGSTGKFYSFGSTWQPVVDKGLAKIGDLKFKNISKVSANKWNCLEMLIRRENSVPMEQVWSFDGVITMSSDGKTFIIESNTMLLGRPEYSSGTYKRQ
jgi:hypothetical protein